MAAKRRNDGTRRETLTRASDKVRGLSVLAQLTFADARIGHQSAAVPGIGRYSADRARAQFGVQLRTLRKALVELANAGVMFVDEQAEVAFVPIACTERAPVTIFYVSSWGSAWHDIPPCALRDRAAGELCRVLATKGPEFVDEFVRVTGVHPPVDGGPRSGPPVVDHESTIAPGTSLDLGSGNLDLGTGSLGLGACDARTPAHARESDFEESERPDPSPGGDRSGDSARAREDSVAPAAPPPQNETGRAITPTNDHRAIGDADRTQAPPPTGPETQERAVAEPPPDAPTPTATSPVSAPPTPVEHAEPPSSPTSPAASARLDVLRAVVAEHGDLFGNDPDEIGAVIGRIDRSLAKLAFENILWPDLSTEIGNWVQHVRVKREEARALGRAWTPGLSLEQFVSKANYRCADRPKDARIERERARVGASVAAPRDGRSRDSAVGIDVDDETRRQRELAASMATKIKDPPRRIGAAAREADDKAEIAVVLDELDVDGLLGPHPFLAPQLINKRSDALRAGGAGFVLSPIRENLTAAWESVRDLAGKPGKEKIFVGAFVNGVHKCADHEAALDALDPERRERRAMARNDAALARIDAQEQAKADAEERQRMAEERQRYEAERHDGETIEEWRSRWLREARDRALAGMKPPDFETRKPKRGAASMGDIMAGLILKPGEDAA